MEHLQEIIANWQFWLEKGLEIFGAAVALASLIVKLTPSDRDDQILAKVAKVFDWLSIVNTKINNNKIQFVDDHTFSEDDCPVILEHKGEVK